MSVGSDLKKVNTKSAKLFIKPDGSDLEYILLQDKTWNPSHDILVEPSTSAGVTLYTGSLNGTIVGTLLFSNDMLTDTGGYQTIATINSDTNQLPIETWKLKLVGFDGVPITFTCLGMLENFELVGPAEGGLKYNITIRMSSFNASSDIT